MARAGIRATAPTGPFPELGYLVRDIAKGLTTRQIMEKAPVSKTTAWELTNGNYVDPETLLAFAQAFEVPVNRLRHAMKLPVYPVDPVTNQPWLTVDFLMPLLEPELAAYVKAQAEALGIHDGDPEPLRLLLNRLLKQGIASESEP